VDNWGGRVDHGWRVWIRTGGRVWSRMFARRLTRSRMGPSHHGCSHSLSDPALYFFLPCACLQLERQIDGEELKVEQPRGNVKKAHKKRIYGTNGRLPPPPSNLRVPLVASKSSSWPNVLPPTHYKHNCNLDRDRRHNHKAQPLPQNHIKKHNHRHKHNLWKLNPLSRRLQKR
jgi:hypothetical protein